MENGHPIIHVYCAEYSQEEITPEIQKIRDYINSYHQYYTDYHDIHDLKAQIRRDYINLLTNSRARATQHNRFNVPDNDVNLFDIQ